MGGCVCGVCVCVCVCVCGGGGGGGGGGRGGETRMDHFMLSNFIKSKMRMCIEKMYENKVIKNNHMQKIMICRKHVTILVLFTLLKNV